MKRAFALVVYGAVAGWASSARADLPAACPRSDGPWLELRAEEGFPPDTARLVREQLAADLARRGVEVCSGARRNGAPPPLARIEAKLAGDELTLDVVDSATDKRLERTASLRGIPADARPLGIAVAADELLRASWLEALLARPPDVPRPAAAAPPPIVRRIAMESVAKPQADASSGSSRITTLELVLAGEHATGGRQSLGGFDARVGWGNRVVIGGRVGYRLGVVANAQDGEVDSNELLGGASVGWSMTARARPWGAELFARGDIARVEYAGRALPPARPLSGAGVGAFAGAGVGGWGGIGGPWRVVAELSLGVPLRAVAAQDNGREVTSTSGLIVGLALGAGAAL
jgi:hypothetical protein